MIVNISNKFEDSSSVESISNKNKVYLNSIKYF